MLHTQKGNRRHPQASSSTLTTAFDRGSVYLVRQANKSDLEANVIEQRRVIRFFASVLFVVTHAAYNGSP